MRDPVFSGKKKEVKTSLPISRVLSWTVIPLGLASLLASSDLPGPGMGHALVGPYLVLLRVGFSIAVECCHLRGALLPHHFNLTGHASEESAT